MDSITAKLTVLFQDPFWIAVYERTVNGKFEAAKVLFGAEPKDYEVYDYFLKNFTKLRFSPPVAEEAEKTKIINPKRMQRAISRQISQIEIGTKAQRAFQLQQEQNKLEHKAFHKQREEEEKQHQFELRQQKKKEKHRGR